jgi:hypothetical protein
VAADHARDQALVAQVVQAALLAVALAGGVDQGQVRAAAALGQEALLQRHRQALGKADADEAAGGHGVAVVDQAHRLGGCRQLTPAARWPRLRRSTARPAGK